MANEERYYIGTDLKFAFTITCEGFSMDNDDYELQLKCGNKTVLVDKTDIVIGENETYYLLVDTTQFPSGVLKMVVTAHVPDSDFDNGIRREVGKLDLCYISHA